MTNPHEVVRMAQQEIDTADETILRAARALINSLQKKRRDRLKANGRCPDCAAPVEGAYKTCLACRRERRRRRLRKTA